MKNVDRCNTAVLLDMIRGVAALLVVAGHTRKQVADSLHVSPSGDTVLEKVLLLPTSFAMEAVAIFFVLSGFLVGGQVIRENLNGRFNWRAFLIKRLSRLWTVLVPGLIVTWLIWSLVTNVFPGVVPAATAEQARLPVAICNAFFLQEARCSSYSFNDSLWSLSYEFWFYIVFAGAASIFFAAGKREWGTTIVSAAIVVGAILLFGPALLLLMPAWLIGVVAARYADRSGYFPGNKGERSAGALLGALLLLLAALFVSNLLGLGRASLTLLVSIPATLLILTAVSLKSDLLLFKFIVRLGVWLGRMSFSIYVFHLPFVVFLVAVMGASGLSGAFGLVGATYTVLLVTIPFTWSMWWLSERHTSVVRAYMFRWAGDKPRAGVDVNVDGLGKI